MSNLKDIIDNIYSSIDKLYNYNTTDCIKLDNYIGKLMKWIGIRTLKMDLGRFKKGEMVRIIQDESGAWLCSLDDEDSRMIDLYDYTQYTMGEMFY